MYANWGGWFPHPELDLDIPPRPRHERIAALLGAQSTAMALRYTMRNDVTREALLREQRVKRDITPEQALTIMNALRRHVTFERLIEAPEDGVFTFIRRVALLRQPICMSAFWELEEGIEQITGLRVSTVSLNSWRNILDWLDQKSAELKAMI